MNARFCNLLNLIIRLKTAIKVFWQLKTLVLSKIIRQAFKSQNNLVFKVNTTKIYFVRLRNNLIG